MTQPTARLTVSVDWGLCMGSGYCVRAHARRFALRPDGVAEVLAADPPRSVGEGPIAVDVDEEAVIRNAAAICPSGAITVQQI